MIEFNYAQILIDAAKVLAQDYSHDPAATKAIDYAHDAVTYTSLLAKIKAAFLR